MHSVVRASIVGLILLSCIGCDQMTKHLAYARLKDREPQSFCGDVFRLEYAENPGAFLSVGAGMPRPARWVLLVFVNGLIATTVGVVLCRRLEMRWLGLLASSLLLGGAVGNLIDRVTFDGLVIDFLNLGIGPLRTGIFNVADVAITTGTLLSLFLLCKPDPTSTAPQD